MSKFTKALLVVILLCAVCVGAQLVYQRILLEAANKTVDNIIPLYINTAMPGWFTAVFMVTLLSAAMSTLSSQFHAMGTSVGRDVYEKWLGGKGNSIVITKIGIMIAIVISLMLAWGLPLFFEGGTAIIARGTAIFFGLCASAFLPMFVGGLFTKSLNKTGALWGFWAGLSISTIWLFFVHIKESQPLLLCKALFGVDSLAQGTLWTVVDPLVIAMPIAIVVTLVANRLGKPLPEEHLDHCFHGIK